MLQGSLGALQFCGARLDQAFQFALVFLDFVLGLLLLADVAALNKNPDRFRPLIERDTNRPGFFYSASSRPEGCGQYDLK